MVVEPKYLKGLRNPVTNTVIKSIPQFFVYLFETYGDINRQEPYHLVIQVENMNFLPDKSIEMIFIEIDDLGTIVELVDAPMKEQQKINMRYILIQQAQVYSPGLTKWNQKDPQDQIWNNFRTQLHKAQKALRCPGALLEHDSMDHKKIVNLVQQGVQQVLNTQQPPPTKPTSHTSTCLPGLDESLTPTSTASINFTMSKNVTIQTTQQQRQMMQK